MSEETQQIENDGTWSTLKKTLIGTIATIITGGGAWFGSHLFGGETEEKEQAPIQQVAPAPVINITNTQQQSNNNGGSTVIIKEVPSKPVEKKVEVKKKEGDEFKNKEPQW